jgi:DNA-binding beta-propeller fold protein YncE
MMTNVVSTFIHAYSRSFAIVLFLGLSATVRAETPPLVVGEPIAVTGTKGRFDYLQVDEKLNRLLASHTHNGTLDVFDLPAGKLKKSIPTGAAQGVAVDADHDRYYVTVSDKKQLVIVDRSSLEILGNVPLSGPPDGLVYNPKNGLVYVDHDDGEDLWVIDPSAKKIVATIKVPEAPEYILYDPASDRVYQNIKSQPVTLVVDPAANKVVATWSTLPATAPHGLAIDSKTHRLFSVGGNGKLTVLDAASGKALASVDTVPGVDQIAFDPINKRIYCPGGKAGELTVLEETSEGAKSLGSIKVPVGTHTLAIDPNTHDVWIAYGSEADAFVCKLSVPQS